MQGIKNFELLELLQEALDLRHSYHICPPYLMVPHCNFSKVLVSLMQAYVEYTTQSFDT